MVFLLIKCDHEIHHNSLPKWHWSLKNTLLLLLSVSCCVGRTNREEPSFAFKFSLFFRTHKAKNNLIGPNVRIYFSPLVCSRYRKNLSINQLASTESITSQFTGTIHYPLSIYQAPVKAPFRNLYDKKGIGLQRWYGRTSKYLSTKTGIELQSLILDMMDGTPHSWRIPQHVCGSDFLPIIKKHLVLYRHFILIFHKRTYLNVIWFYSPCTARDRNLPRCCTRACTLWCHAPEKREAIDIFAIFLSRYSNRYVI